jgi:hypothetical protein
LVAIEIEKVRRSRRDPAERWYHRYQAGREVRSMKKALVAAVGSLLVAMPAFADESPKAGTSAEHVAAPTPPAVTGDATPTTTSEQTDKAAVRKKRPTSADDAANKSEASQIKQVPLKGPGDGTVCRTEYPTGSRIGVRRCHSTTETAGSKIDDEIMRRDLQEMRDRQMFNQLQRASLGMTPAIPGMPPR